MDDKYLDLLNSEIMYVYEREVNAQDMVDEAEAHVAELRAEVDKLHKRCKLLKLLRARHLCPFKVGDRVKHWSYFDKDKTAVVTGIYSSDISPFCIIEVDRDGEPFKLLFDSYRVEPVDADEKMNANG